MVRRNPEPEDVTLPPPARTLEGRENQLVAAAFDLVEKRIAAGTASAQETVHFLRLGTTRERLEQDKLKQEHVLLQSRIKELEARGNGDEKLDKALKAFRGYSGQEPIEDDDEHQDLYGT